MATNGSILALERAHWLVVMSTADGRAAAVELAFEPGTVAVSAHGSFVAAAGEGQLTVVEIDESLESRNEFVLPIDEPEFLAVSDTGVAVAVDGAMATVSRPGHATVHGRAGDPLDLGLVMVGDIAIRGGRGTCGVVVAGVDDVEVLAIDGEVPDDVVAVGARVGLRRDGRLELVEVLPDGRVSSSGHLDVDDVERLVASASGRYLVAAAARWDGSVDHLDLVRHDLEADRREHLAADGAAPDARFVVIDDGTVQIAVGSIRPARVIVDRLGGAGVALIDVDLDALVDALG